MQFEVSCPIKKRNIEEKKRNGCIQHLMVHVTHLRQFLNLPKLVTDLELLLNVTIIFM